MVFISLSSIRLNQNAAWNIEVGGEISRRILTKICRAVKRKAQIIFSVASAKMRRLLLTGVLR